MKKTILYSYFPLLVISIITGLCYGCGHNVLTTSKGIGLELVMSGDNTMPTFRGGEWDAVSYVPRGNTAMSMTTSTGGILGTGGTSQTITVTAGTQLNEGNITSILTSENCPDVAKVVLSESLKTLIKDPVIAPETSARTTYAAAASGPDAILVKTESTGVDKIVDKVAENAEPIKEVLNTTVNKTGDVLETTVNTAGNTVTSISLSAILATKWLLIVITIAVVIIVLLAVKLLIKVVPIIVDYFKNRKLTVDAVGVNVVSEIDKDGLTVKTPIGTSDSITVSSLKSTAEEFLSSSNLKINK